MTKTLLRGLSMLVILAATPAAAFEPTALDIAIGKVTAVGAADLAPTAKQGDARVEVLLTNHTREFDALVQFPICTYDPLSTGVLVGSLEDILVGKAPPVGQLPAVQDPAWAACVLTRSLVPGVFRVRQGETVKVRFGVDFRALGHQHVILTAHVWALPPAPNAATVASSRALKLPQIEDLLRRAPKAAEQPVSFFYDVVQPPQKKPMYRLATYDDLYLRNQPTDERQGGGVGTMPYVDGVLPVALADYQTFRPVVPDSVQYNPDHPDIRQVDTSTAGPNGGCDCVNPGRQDCTLAPCDQRTSPALAPLTPGATFTVTGRYSAKWTDHTLHPAWGWRAVAWWNDGGGWTVLADDWVQWDGSYRLVFSAPGYAGQHLRMQFRAYNRFFQPQTQGGDTYRWVNPDRVNIPLTWDEGHWFADCDGSDVNGLGELYFRGYQLWSEMYWRAGISPLRASAIHMFYPNTFENCGTSSPWSCASVDGNIWLIPAHGTNRGTVQHELGHQINYEFWGNRRPAGCCGSHSASSCYTPGLALLEGYANFVPIWVQTNRSAVPDSGIRPYEIEAPAASICKTPGRNNEAWVSATLWDLHDSHGDGSDILWFNNAGAVHAIYFAHGPGSDGAALGLSDFRTHYESAASAGHQTYIDNIFTQNGTN